MNRLATAILVPALLCCATAASAVDFEFGAYVQLPFGNGGTIFGLSAKPGFPSEFEQESSLASGTQQAGLHWQFGPAIESVVRLNGVLLGRTQLLNQDRNAGSEDQQSIDWHVVAAAAVGIGLIAAVANADDASVSICSGTNCPPAKPEPDEPEEQ